MLILKDNSGKYAETLNSWIFEQDIRNEDLVQIESSYAILGNVEGCSELVANYNLIVFGDLTVEKVNVKKDLFVLGKVKTKDLLVSGNMECKNSIDSNSVKIGRSLSAKSVQIETGLIGWNLIVESSFVDQSLVVENELICLEGIAGAGTCTAKKVFIKEYKNIEIISEQEIILSQGFKTIINEGSKNKPELSRLMVENLFEKENLMDEYNRFQLKLANFLIDNFEKYVSNIEERFDYDDISQTFNVIQKRIPTLGNYIENFKQIMRFGDTNSIKYVEEFITLMNLKHTTPKFFYKISIVNDVLLGFYNSQKENLQNLKLQNPEIDNVIHNLYFLNQRKYLLSKEEYTTLFSKLAQFINTESNIKTEEVYSEEQSLIELLNYIPEVKDGKVKIKSVSREKGIRSKVAVYSNDKTIDPVGACIGYKGERILQITDALEGEKIDIILWSNMREEFIKNALNPAQVLNVQIFDKNAVVEVTSDHYTSAIGKNGVNTKLASKLTGYKIEVKMS